MTNPTQPDWLPCKNCGSTLSPFLGKGKCMRCPSCGAQAETSNNQFPSSSRSQENDTEALVAAWKTDLIEKLAAIEHERWADWQRWMHEVLRKSGELTEGADEILKRWDKQIETPYDGLSETEKQSDRDQVMRYWPLLFATIVEAKESVAFAIVSTKTEGIIDDGEVFIKQEPLNQTIINIVGYEKFKAMQESVDAFKKEQS